MQLDNAIAAVTPSQAITTAKKQRISKKLRHAIDLLVTGACKYQKDAAARANLTPEHLSRSLAEPHVRVFLAQRARQNISVGAARASAVMSELLDADSNGVRFDAARFCLGVEGIKPQTDPQVSVNIELKAGYVLDLREDSPARSQAAAGTDAKLINGLAHEQS